MKRYEVEATLTITVKVRVVDYHDEVSHDSPETIEEGLQDLIMAKFNKQLVLLDIEGGRTGDDGYVTAIDCESIDHWEYNE